jgi:hypothetical protein
MAFLQALFFKLLAPDALGNAGCYFLSHLHIWHVGDTTFWGFTLNSELSPLTELV